MATSNFKAGLIIDAYKLDTFKKHLDFAGYKYEWIPDLLNGTGMLKVFYIRATEAAILHKICKSAQEEILVRNIKP